jgi:hypothetical protein
MNRRPANHPLQLYLAASAAFCTYFCMYAFRKPFTAATFEELEFYGTGLKSALVLSQLLGYMLSKFIGIKVVAELRGDNRGKAIVCLIALAQLALVGFAFVSVPLKVAMLFLNGLALGMVFGLVLSLLLTNLLMIAFLAVVAYQGTVLATTVIPQKSAALRLSFFWPYMAIPFGAGLMIIQLLLVVARDFVHPEAVVPDDSERAW